MPFRVEGRERGGGGLGSHLARLDDWSAVVPGLWQSIEQVAQDFSYSLLFFLLLLTVGSI